MSFIEQYKEHEDESFGGRKYLDSLCRIISMTDAEKVRPENELLIHFFDFDESPPLFKNFLVISPKSIKRLYDK